MIAVLGPEGTFSEEAAKKLFPREELVYFEEVDEVMESVERGVAKYGILPIENSIEGSVGSVLYSLLEKNVKISKETTLDISLCLMALPDTEVKTIISHPHAIAQCKKFINKNYPSARIELSNSTSKAANEVAGGKKRDTAIIGSKAVSRIYGLKILKENIQDYQENKTRFIAVGLGESNGQKTSLIFTLKDRPGALYEALGEFAKRKINLTKIESKPSRKSLGEYLFFVDFEGDLKGKKESEALENIRKKTAFLKILGSYQVV